MKTKSQIVLFMCLLGVTICGCKDESALRPVEGPKSDTAMALANAVNNNDFEALRIALQDRVNPNIVFVDGTTVLHTAASWGRVECVKLLLDNGADPNIISAYGTTLHCASQDSDCPEVVRMLLEKGVDLDVENLEGHTALEVARMNNLHQNAALIESAMEEE